jgi:hypothetical protein
MWRAGGWTWTRSTPCCSICAPPVRRPPPKGVPDTTAANLVIRGYRKDQAAGHREKQAPADHPDPGAADVAACDLATVVGRRDRLVLGAAWAHLDTRLGMIGPVDRSTGPIRFAGRYVACFVLIASRGNARLGTTADGHVLPLWTVAQCILRTGVRPAVRSANDGPRPASLRLPGVPGHRR